nr:hypothetical protein [Tanacetum cinerariifolium]
MQTQTSNTLHNAIMEAGDKDRLPMLAPDLCTTIEPTHLVMIGLRNSECSEKDDFEDDRLVVVEQQVQQEEARIQLNAKQADWRYDTDDESKDQELEAHYMYMAQIQEVTPDAADNSGPLFDYDPLQKKPKWVMDATYHKEKMILCKQEEARIQLNAKQADWRYDTDDESKDQELEAHYMYMAQIQEVTPDAADNSGPLFDYDPLQKIEQDEHNVIIDSFDMSYDREQIDQDDDDDLANERELLASLIEKLKCEIDDSKTRNKFLETSNKVLVDKLKELFAHQETISILSQAKEAQIKLYKTCEDKELDKFIALENKIKVLDNIVYKTGQSVQTINMLNHNCKTSFAKPEFLKKAQRANPRLYDIGCYNDNLALMLAPESDEEMVADLRYFNSLKLEVDSLKSQLETQKTQFLNEIDRLSREYYYADHMIAIIGVYTLQCDYLEMLEKRECLEKELIKSKKMSKSFEALQKHEINLEIDLQQCQEKIKNDKSFKENQSKELRKEREQYFKIQDLKAQF